MLEKGTWAGIMKLKGVCKIYGWFQVLNLSYLFIAAPILTWSTSRKDWLLFVTSGKDQANFFFAFCLVLPEFVWICLKASRHLCCLSWPMWNVTVCGFTDNSDALWFPWHGTWIDCEGHWWHQDFETIPVFLKSSVALFLLSVCTQEQWSRTWCPWHSSLPLVRSARMKSKVWCTLSSVLLLRPCFQPHGLERPRTQEGLLSLPE